MQRFVTISTIDSPAAEVVREAMSDAGITAQLIDVKPANGWMQMVPRPMLDVQVDAADEKAARAVMAALEHESSEAVGREWEGTDGQPGGHAGGDGEGAQSAAESRGGGGFAGLLRSIFGKRP